VRYALFDIEVTRPLSDLPLSAEDTGVAILVRRKGVPIAFWLQGVDGIQHIPAEELARRIASEAGEKIVAETIREELTSRCSAVCLPSLTIAICTKDRPEGVERLLGSLHQKMRQVPATKSLSLITHHQTSEPENSRHTTRRSGMCASPAPA